MESPASVEMVACMSAHVVCAVLGGELGSVLCMHGLSSTVALLRSWRAAGTVKRIISAVLSSHTVDWCRSFTQLTTVPMSVTDDATLVDGRRADARPSIMLHASQSFVPSKSCHEDGYQAALRESGPFAS